jgi:CrcB protein
MDGWSALCIFVGAGVGALLRWFLSATFNPIFPPVPLGTLASNILGGFLMGIVLGIFSQFDSLPPAVRLLATTGFLGGLTTFSTFSGEAVTTVMRQEYAWALAIVAVHVSGSLLATLAGIGVMRLVFKT